MDEVTDQPPERGSHPPIPAARARLSPVQEAWGAYVDHATHCTTCRSPDDGSCVTAEALYRTYEQQGANASRKVWETP